MRSLRLHNKDLFSILLVDLQKIPGRLPTYAGFDGAYPPPSITSPIQPRFEQVRIVGDCESSFPNFVAVKNGTVLKEIETVDRKNAKHAKYVLHKCAKMCRLL